MSLNGACTLGSLVPLNRIDPVLLDLGGDGGAQVPPAGKPSSPGPVYDTCTIEPPFWVF
jgi:hypothetical protein